MKILLMLTVLTAPTVCSPTTRTSYVLYTSVKSWNDAMETCKRNRQSLLIERDEVTTKVIARFRADPEWAVFLSERYTWIGLHRHYKAPNSPHVWYDCTGSGSYDNWDTRQLDPDGLCVSSSWDTGTWRSTPCDRKLPFICEMNIGRCLFDIRRTKKYPDPNAGQFFAKSAIECVQLCRETLIGDLECWALTYYWQNHTCFVHLFSEPLVNPDQVVLETDRMADVYLKNCFKADINTYSVHTTYAYVTPYKGCWIEEFSGTPSGMTSHTSMISSNHSQLWPSLYNESGPSDQLNESVSSISSGVETLSTYQHQELTPQTTSVVPHSPVAGLDPSSHAQSSIEVISDSHSSSSNRLYKDLVTESLLIDVPLKSSTFDVSSSSVYDDFGSTQMEFPIISETVVSYSPLVTDNLIITLDPSPATTTNPSNLQTMDLESSTSGSNGNMFCWCPCVSKVPENLTTDDMKEIAEEIVREIKVDVNNLSSTQRKYISVDDKRSSAQGIGVMGVGMMCIVFGGILALDCITMCKNIWHLWQNARELSTSEMQKRQAEKIFLKSFSEDSGSKGKLIFETN